MLMWIVLLLCGIVSYFIYDAKRKRQYWLDKGIPVPKISPVLGSFVEIAKMGQSKFDMKYTQALGRLFGYFDGPTPVLVTSDTEMIKNVLVKDFPQFQNRRDFDLNGPVIGKAVSVLRGQQWKDVRSVLLPTFTSGKLRQMNSLINECCQRMLNKMEQIEKSGEEFEGKELYGRVTLDVIATTFFGTQIDSQNDPDNAFVKHAKSVFNFSFGNPVFLIAFLCPKLIPWLSKLGVQFLPRADIDFFVKNTEEIIRMRVESKQVRRDFLQIMLSHLSSNEKLAIQSEPVKETVSEIGHDQDIISDVLTMDAPSGKMETLRDYKLTLEEVVAQAVIFFIAGYETTATALSFLTYALAVNPDIQEKLFEEVEQIMQGKDSPTYDQLAQMEYLDACINETFRMYPPVSRTERECNEEWDYKGVRYEKGTIMVVPIYEIHHDPEYWPDPETFDPERFSRENKPNIKPYTFLTFGQGPRNCMGMRFAYYEIKFVVACVVQKYRILKSPRTQVPLELKDIGFLSAKDGVWVKLEKR